MREQAVNESKIRHLELQPPLVVAEDQRISDVLKLLRQKKQGCVLICKDDRCTGIFTERDYLTRIFGRGEDLNRPISDFMTPNPVRLTADHSVGEAISLMSERGVRNVPLIDQDGKLKGLLRIRDIIDFLAEHYPQEILNAPHRSEQLFEEPDGA